MTATQIDAEFQLLRQVFAPLYSEFTAGNSFPERRPLLAHYTSTANLERILATDELWFSNPLLMNDLEELRFGVLEGAQRFIGNAAIEAACSSANRAKVVFNAFSHYLDEFSSKHAVDVYALCTAEHDASDTDGLLSMWRGYGGNGNGAAIVFDTAKINVTNGSPLVISNVVYASTDQRRAWLDTKLIQFAEILKEQNIPDDKLYMASWIMFERIRLFALFTKHHGFKEEHEWRVVYLKERDTQNKLAPMLHYAVTARGLEPRLKFPVKPVEGVTSDDLSLAKLVDRIILGPTANSPLAMSTLHRVLDATGKGALKEKVVTSTIPYRT